MLNHTDVNHSLSDYEAALFLRELIAPTKICEAENTRNRAAPTRIKFVYHLFQLTKNVRSGKWDSIYMAIPNMARDARVSKRKITEQ